MSDGQPTWQLVKAAAERLTAAGNSPFKLEDLILEVQRRDPARERGSISPIVQGMTANAGMGPRSAAGTIFRRTDHGFYELAPHATAGQGHPAPVTTDHPQSRQDAQPLSTAGADAGLSDAAVQHEGLSAPPGDSAAQRAAEAVILAAVGAKLGVSLAPRRLNLGDGVHVDVDGVSDEPPVLCEVWAHQGSSKVAQGHKVLHDALKLFVAAESRTPRPRLILAVTDTAAATRFRGRSWYGVALRRLGVELLLVDIPQDVRDTIWAAQARQFR
jgi:hypothetical protein